jgi:hypothetical protein
MRRSLIARLERLERKLKPELGLLVIVAIPDFSEPVRYVSPGAAEYVWDRAPGECAADFTRRVRGEVERIAKTVIFITPFEAGIG